MKEELIHGRKERNEKREKSYAMKKHSDHSTGAVAVFLH